MSPSFDAQVHICSLYFIFKKLYKWQQKILSQVCVCVWYPAFENKLGFCYWTLVTKGLSCVFSLSTFFFFFIFGTNGFTGNNRGVSSLGCLEIRVSQVFLYTLDPYQLAWETDSFCRPHPVINACCCPFLTISWIIYPHFFCTAQPWGTSSQPEEKNAVFLQDSRRSTLCWAPWEKLC